MAPKMAWVGIHPLEDTPYYYSYCYSQNHSLKGNMDFASQDIPIAETMDLVDLAEYLA